MKTKIKFFPSYKEEDQKKIMAEVGRVWQQGGAELDPLTASVTFRMRPKATTMIINYTLANLKFRSFREGFKHPGLSGSSLFTFIRNMTKDLDMWPMPPIIRSGLDRAYKFLEVFGGKLHYREQFLANSPLSLHEILCDIVTKRSAGEWLGLLREMRMESFVLPSTSDFMRCLGGKSKGKSKSKK